MRGVTLPWQLVALHEPGPVYLLGSAGGCAGAANAGSTAANDKTSGRTDRLILRTTCPRCSAACGAGVESPAAGTMNTRKSRRSVRPASRFAYTFASAHKSIATTLLVSRGPKKRRGRQLDDAPRVCYIESAERGFLRAMPATAEPMSERR